MPMIRFFQVRRGKTEQKLEEKLAAAEEEVQRLLEFAKCFDPAYEPTDELWKVEVGGRSADKERKGAVLRSRLFLAVHERERLKSLLRRFEKNRARKRQGDLVFLISFPTTLWILASSHVLSGVAAGVAAVLTGVVMEIFLDHVQVCEHTLEMISTDKEEREAYASADSVSRLGVELSGA